MLRLFALKKRLLITVLLATLVLTSFGPFLARPALAAPGAFDVQAFLERQPGALKQYRDGRYRAAQVIQGYATYYNLDPRTLLALLELVPHLLTTPNPPREALRRPFGNSGPDGFTGQVDWAAREIRAGFGPYTAPPQVSFTDGSSATLPLDQDPSLIAVQRFLAQGRTQAEWGHLKARYAPLFRQLFGSEPETVTPAPTPAAGRPFLKLPWPAIYPAAPGDPLTGKPVRMVHSSFFDHVYPTVDRGPDGNNFVVTYLNTGNVSYNSHDGHDYYFPDRPIGTPIVAAADGIAYALTTRGNGVVIRHTGAYAGYETVYWHLDAFDQKFAGRIDTGTGVEVQAGDYLGVSGKSGFTDGGAHLHFEVRHNGRQVDPYGWFGPGTDPCAVWTAGCEASVWLWDDSLRGSYDFTSPEAPAPRDTEAPAGTLSVVTDPDLKLLLHFDDQPVQSVGVGAPTIAAAHGKLKDADLQYEDGVFGRAVRVVPGAELSYPITGNLQLSSGSLSLWAKLPARYGSNGTGRHYLFAASAEESDTAHGVYTGTLALRREETAGDPRWNFWTVDDKGLRHDLVFTDTLQPGWHHFAVTWQSSGSGARGEKQLYIDGIPVANAANVSLPSFVGETLKLGHWTQGHGDIGAALDELAVFGRPLNASEVQSLARRTNFVSGDPGPLDSSSSSATRNVVLDTNAIDRQGGVVSVRLRRDGEPWGEPVPYYDSYRWSITGTEGVHTFAVEYRDRADNVSVVTTTVTLASPPRGTVSLLRTDDLSATLRLVAPGGAPSKVQLSGAPDFADAEWQPFKEELPWSWQPGRPRIVYVRFQQVPGVPGPTLPFGPDVKQTFLPLIRK
jgi:murein DD-endopeptidase MepM/ murein hydrolase activator NlpD